jgi:hypothetical protein
MRLYLWYLPLTTVTVCEMLVGTVVTVPFSVLEDSFAFVDEFLTDFAVTEQQVLAFVTEVCSILLAYFIGVYHASAEIAYGKLIAIPIAIYCCRVGSFRCTLQHEYHLGKQSFAQD